MLTTAAWEEGLRAFLGTAVSDTQPEATLAPRLLGSTDAESDPIEDASSDGDLSRRRGGSAGSSRSSRSRGSQPGRVRAGPSGSDGRGGGGGTSTGDAEPGGRHGVGSWRGPFASRIGRRPHSQRWLRSLVQGWRRSLAKKRQAEGDDARGRVPAQLPAESVTRVSGLTAEPVARRGAVAAVQHCRGRSRRSQNQNHVRCPRPCLVHVLCPVPHAQSFARVLVRCILFLRDKAYSEASLLLAQYFLAREVPRYPFLSSKDGHSSEKPLHPHRVSGNRDGARCVQPSVLSHEDLSENLRGQRNFQNSPVWA